MLRARSDVVGVVKREESGGQVHEHERSATL